jgi:hypothetical protein
MFLPGASQTGAHLGQLPPHGSWPFFVWPPAPVDWAASKGPIPAGARIGFGGLPGGVLLWSTYPF